MKLIQQFFLGFLLWLVQLPERLFVRKTENSEQKKGQKKEKPAASIGAVSGRSVRSGRRRVGAKSLSLSRWIGWISVLVSVLMVVALPVYLLPFFSETERSSDSVYEEKIPTTLAPRPSEKMVHAKAGSSDASDSDQQPNVGTPTGKKEPETEPETESESESSDSSSIDIDRIPSEPGSVLVEDLHVGRSIKTQKARVLGKVVNHSAKRVDALVVTILFLDAAGQPIARKRILPLVTSGGIFGDTMVPLNPGALRRFGVDAENVPPTWSGQVRAEIMMNTIE